MRTLPPFGATSIGDRRWRWYRKRPDCRTESLLRRAAEMAHTRRRKFNTRDTYPEQKLDNDLCQAVVAGDTIYLRGQVAQDLDTRENVAVGDPAGQADHAMDNVELLLAECGASLEHICKVTV